VRCGACRHENPEGSRFCNRCGAELEPACRACGHANPAGARFCNACGAALDPGSTGAGAGPGRGSAPPGAGVAGPGPDRGETAAAAAPPLREQEPDAYTPRHLAERILRTRSALEGERKHVTVLFCDVADSVPLAERLGPEGMHTLMDRAFRVILERVHGYEGTVNQFLGDGAMALFGAPLALEDAPRRAVSAALAIQRGLAPLGREVEERFGIAFRMRIGIHAGPVVVGRIGDDLRMDYTAVGDTTNLAARLQAQAPPGGVLLSEAVARLATGFFDLEDAGALAVKGKAEPVRAFRALRERSGASRLEAAERLTPLVGRERELGLLREAFDAARAGRGQAVFVVGEAGAGKSRLLHELRARLGDDAHLWLECRCASHAQSAAFHALADGLRRAFGIEEGDPDAAALAKIEAVERRRGGELAWTLPYVRLVLSLPSGDAEVDRLDAATRRSNTFGALRARLLRAAEERPLVLVVEDLHWIDRASEELMAYLLDSIPAARVLALLTHRPGYRHPFGDRSYHQRLVLQSLSEEETARMARHVLDGAEPPEELWRLVARKAEGNPFFVEEVLRSLLEEGALRRIDGRVELARDLDALEVPDRIQDVLMARLDRLPEEPKRALQTASVIGREFALRLLERIHEAGDRVAPMVEELRALELIYEKAVHPELAYMFKHALTHDVAYESVLRSRRRALHGIVAATIEELYRERLPEHYAALAHHYAQAEEWGKALHYCERASAQAAEAFANESAAEHCRRGLEAARRLGPAAGDDRRRVLEERLGAVCRGMSEMRASGEAYLRAAALSASPEDRARNLGRAAHSFYWGHDYDDMDRALAGIRELGRSHPVPEGEAYALLLESFRHGTFGEPERYAELLDRGRRLVGEDVELRAIVRYLHGQAAEWAGDYATAHSASQEGAEIARKGGLPFLVIGGQWFGAKALCCLGRYGEALAGLREALELSERIGDLAWRTRILNTIGWWHAEVGDDAGAEPYNRRSAELAHEMLARELVAGVPELLGNAQVNLAGNRIALGELGAAADALAPVEEELSRPGDPWMRWRYGLHLLDAQARLALARSEPEAALALARREAEGGRRHHGRKIEARALALAGRSLVAMDARDEAEEALRAALAAAEAIGYPPVQWRAHALLAEIARRRGESRDRVDAASHRGRALLEGVAASVGSDGPRRAAVALAERIAADPLAAGR